MKGSQFHSWWHLHSMLATISQILSIGGLTDHRDSQSEGAFFRVSLLSILAFLNVG